MLSADVMLIVRVAVSGAVKTATVVMCAGGMVRMLVRMLTVKVRVGDDAAVAAVVMCAGVDEHTLDMVLTVEVVVDALC